MPPNHTKSTSGIQKLAKPLKSFDLEFQPFIEEINAKERVIRDCADAATMERVRSKYSTFSHRVGYNRIKSNAFVQVLRVFSRILHQS